MRPVRRFLPSLLAVLLLMQWTAALAPCLRSLNGLASAVAVTLCSPAGQTRVLLVDEDGREVPKPKPHPVCPLCQHVEAAVLPDPTVAPAPIVIIAMVSHDRMQPGLPPLPPRGPPQQPRAPPTA